MAEPIYIVDISSTDEMDIIEKLLYFYSSTLVVRGKVRDPLPDRLVKFLAIYLKYGYSKESKNLIKEVLGVDSNIVNQTNFRLTELGYLETNPIRSRDKNLNRELRDLKSFYEIVFASDKKRMLLNINFNN